MTGGDAPVPHLRRDPNPQQTSGRKVLIGVAVFFLVLVGFVLTLVFTIGEHNNGVVLPPGASTSPTSTVAPAAAPSPEFFAIDAATGGKSYIGGDATYSSYQHHQRAVAMGAAPDGRTAYYAVPVAGCRSIIYATHAGRTVETTRVRGISGRVLGVPMAVSPDGSDLALALTPQLKRGDGCARSAEAEVLDLKHGLLTPVGIVLPGKPTSLAWRQDGALAVLAGDTVTERRVGCLACEPLFVGKAFGSPVVLFWHGKLAVIVGNAVRALGTELGPTLARGLPDFVVSASVDPTGNKLLLSGGVETTRNPGGITYYATYVWSNGEAFRLPGEWIDPAW
ncbi:MAG TPA: hypothetical protein VHD81_09560 [Mycobacteriales bacterium]|nr:hypothetical protein [Mycobacteriales bacterium]